MLMSKDLEPEQENHQNPRIRMTERTQQQNKALHLYYRLLADALNDAGLNVQKTLAQKIELDWTPEMIKELLWRPAQKTLLRKDSTTDLEKQMDIDLVYEHLNRHIGQKFGIFVPFPHDPTRVDNPMLK